MRLAIIGQQAFGAGVLEAFLDRGEDVAGVFCAPERPGAKFADVVGKPGEICAIGESGVQIAVQGGRLDILKVRLEGGTKMPAQQFAAAAGLEVGDLFAGAAVRQPAVRRAAF